MKSKVEGPRDIPALFSAPMVHALLEDRKTQTRRLAWNPCKACGLVTCKGPHRPSPWTKVRPQDRLWVREAHMPRPNLELVSKPHYRADYDATKWAGLWKPGIHMRRIHSRLTMIVYETRTQDLQDITDADAIAEGVVVHPNGGFWVPGVRHPNRDFPYLSRATPREMYAALWDALHGSGEWLRNPRVVALSFKVHKLNIDKAPHGRV